MLKGITLGIFVDVSGKYHLPLAFLPHLHRSSSSQSPTQKQTQENNGKALALTDATSTTL